MNLPTAPYEVASNPRTLRKGNTLYLDGKAYACPELTVEEFKAMADKIRTALNICDEKCSGLRRWYHTHITKEHK